MIHQVAALISDSAS